LITNSKEEYENFVSKIDASDFELYTIDATILKDIRGHIGNLAVTVDNEGKDTVLNLSQVVWFDSTATKSRSGVYNIDSSCLDEVLTLLKSNINSYKYKKFTTYNETICQYNERRVEICSKCEDVCPSVAITKDDQKKKLTFSQIDCVDCGKCVAVCPSGALDNAFMNKTSFHEISKFYTNKHPLVIVSKNDISALDIELKQDVFPLVIDSEFLDESTLLTLLQLSGSQIAFYSDSTFETTDEVIKMLNDIYQKRFKFSQQDYKK
jgi:ferredoxin